MQKQIAIAILAGDTPLARLYRAGWSIGRLARETGTAKRTIRLALSGERLDLADGLTACIEAIEAGERPTNGMMHWASQQPNSHVQQLLDRIEALGVPRVARAAGVSAPAVRQLFDRCRMRAETYRRYRAAVESLEARP